MNTRFSLSVLVAVALPLLSGSSCAPRLEAVGDIRDHVIQVVFTEDPVSMYDKRSVLDKADLAVEDGGAWRATRLTARKGNHEFWVKARRDGNFIELDYQVILHGKVRRVVSKRFRDDREVKRIWISRAYTHADMGRVCFPAPMTIAPFEGNVWFATLADNRDAKLRGEFEILDESSGKYAYGNSKAGEVTVDFHGGHHYRMSWTVDEETKTHSYKTVLMKGSEVMSVTIEDVFHINDAASCAPSASGDYCDTDNI